MSVHIVKICLFHYLTTNWWKEAGDSGKGKSDKEYSLFCLNNILIVIWLFVQ